MDHLLNNSFFFLPVEVRVHALILPVFTASTLLDCDGEGRFWVELNLPFGEKNKKLKIAASFHTQTEALHTRHATPSLYLNPGGVWEVLRRQKPVRVTRSNGSTITRQRAAASGVGFLRRNQELVHQLLQRRSGQMVSSLMRRTKPSREDTESSFFHESYQLYAALNLPKGDGCTNKTNYFAKSYYKYVNKYRRQIRPVLLSFLIVSLLSRYHKKTKFSCG